MSLLNIKSIQRINAVAQTEITLTLEGNLDNSTATSLQREVMTALAAKPVQLIFDLAGLKYLTSSGIRIFFVSAKNQKAHGGRVSFVNLQPQIKEVFTIMGSLPDMSLFKDQVELDAYLLARQKTYES